MIETTYGRINELWLWEKFCEVTWMWLYAMHEWLDRDEKVTISFSEAEKIWIKITV